MAPTTATRMTPLSALLNAELRAQRGVGLPTYLAIARTPGAGWKTYDEIVADLSTLTDRTLNRVSIKTYTEQLFGIPNTRYAAVNGKQVAMPRAVPEDTLYGYVNALDPAIIDLPAVGEAAYEAAAGAQQRAEDTQAILGHLDGTPDTADEPNRQT